MFDKGMISYYEFIIEIKKIINFKGKLKKPKIMILFPLHQIL